MKVCLVSHLSGMGGAERMLIRMVDGLKARGVECFVLLPGEGPLKEQLAIRQVPYAICPYGWWGGCGGGLRRKLGELARLRVLPRILSQLGRWDVDVILTNTSVVPVGALAACVLRRPHVWYIHEFGQIDGVAGRDHRVICVGNGQRDKVISAVFKRGRERGRHGAHEAFQVRVRDARFAPH